MINHIRSSAIEKSGFPTRLRVRAASVFGAGFAFLAAAHAGHEFPFYPSFYPQEITIEALDARAATQRLAKGTLHAYAGSALAGRPDPAKTGSVASLGGYIVLNLDARAPRFADRAARCAAARSFKPEFAAGQVWHPYPVTPFHADYLHHADLAEAARAPAAAQRIAKPPGKLEAVDAAALAARAGTRYNGWNGPPWLRTGWFHAYLLLAPAVSDAGARARIDAAAHRLMSGEHASLEDRIEREREFVALLQSGCERVVLGYTARREYYSTEYSQGVENVGHDARDGLASGIFIRTVKLRDFPWNGWLNLAVPPAPSSAWNPVVGGFGGAFGQLVWSALGDPAFLPSPHGEGWIENRLIVSDRKAGAPLAVPRDALVPEPGSGQLARAGLGRMATARIVYEVRNSAFHDGTPMSVGDLFYAYAFAAAWSAGDAADPGVAQATALARSRLKGIRLLGVQTETLAFGEDKLTYRIPVIETYLDAGAADGAATIAPPWTVLPWHLLALLEEGARRGHFALSAAGAKRRGVPELDPVRNPAIVRQLEALARELEARAYVPAALSAHATAAEARQRYRRLRDFHAAHGHWLVTNGPYRLARWDGAKAVLVAFRDPSYPKGLGNFNAYAVPLRAYVTRVEPRADGAEVDTEIEWLERAGREVKIVRGSVAKWLAERSAAGARPPELVCRYLLAGKGGAVVAAGSARADATGTCRLKFAGAGVRPGQGGGLLVLAAVQEQNASNAPIKILPWKR
ncbi:MAG TPA: hypothetical protein VLC73_01490 [Burkholderiales bacterium]|nr:hypothetical protein [Burkholderiales bacterium]